MRYLLIALMLVTGCNRTRRVCVKHGEPHRVRELRCVESYGHGCMRFVETDVEQQECIQWQEEPAP